MTKKKALLQAATALLTSTLATSAALAQFTKVINIPPELSHRDRQIDSDTQLNGTDGGNLAGTFRTPFQIGLPDGSSTNVEANFRGGNIGGNVAANAGSAVNISCRPAFPSCVSCVTDGRHAYRLPAKRLDPLS